MENEDRRVKKTKRQLRTALTTLLLEKDINHITVRDVAEKADVNRGTFYAHYRDVFNLLGQLEDELLLHIDEVGSCHSVRRCEGKCLPYLTDLFTVAQDYSDIFYALYCRSGDTAFQDKVFNKLKYQFLYDFLATYGSGENDKLDYCADFIVSGMCTLMRTWIENGTAETPEEMARLGESFIIRGTSILK